MAALALALAGGTRGHAAPVRGSVTLPPEARGPEVRQGQWRVENGILPVAPRSPDPRTEVVIVLEGDKAPLPEKPPGVTVELRGLRLDPRVTIALVGATVSFHNGDRGPHALSFENARSLLPAEPTPSGETRTVRIFAAGEYQLRDDEYPHLEGTIVVVQTPHATLADDKGQFKLEVPEGRYTLKAYHHGGWVISQPLEVGPKGTDVALTLPAAARPAAPAKGEP